MELDEMRYQKQNTQEICSLEKLSGEAVSTDPERFDTLVSKYQQLIVQYVNAACSGAQQPLSAVQSFAESLALLHLKAKDIVRLHIAMLQQVASNQPTSGRRHVKKHFASTTTH